MTHIGKNVKTIDQKSALARVIQSITAWQNDVPETIDRLAEAAIEAISSDPRTVERQVEKVAFDVLTSTDRFAGAGIVSIHPTVTARARSLMWWVAQPAAGRSEPIPLDADLTELGTYQSGLEEIEWYRVPAATRQGHMTGPFVDYMCTDQFAFTFTAPVEISGEFYGVAGIDMTVRSLENEIETLLEALSDNAILLANHNLVAISLDPRFATGSRLKPRDLETYSIIEVPGAALSIAVPH
ncbi:cache domain-containing protein [Brevibacterium oceani]|uniref:cache domain-containing protein n=1 Tax=Brevibacterium oceani TaxID=358099 RepID=UPI001B339DCF|nr:cache domain-containing protein [Brevibacterium oceani]